MTANVAGIRLTLESGADLADRINPRLEELTLTEKRGGEADELALTLTNSDGALAVPEAGAILALAIGWLRGDDVPLGLVDKGRFKVDEIELSGPPDKVTIRARSADLAGAYTVRRTQSWRAVTLGALLGEIAARNGSTARVHPDLTGRQIETIEQHGKSDMAFVMDLGSRYDALATWKDRQLVFLPIGGATNAAGEPLPRSLVRRSDAGQWTFAHTKRDEHDGAEAEYHDPDAGRRRSVGTGGSNPKRLKRTYASEAEARQAAESEAARRQRGSHTFDLAPAIADCARQPNERITLSGWNSTIDAIDWLIESIETRMAAGGLTQTLKLESAS